MSYTRRIGKSYSIDLRLRVLRAVDGGMSKMQVHKMYAISRSTIDDWLALREQTGNVETLPARANTCQAAGLVCRSGF